MAAIAREEGVLKLVHPGRHVEIHTEPITAAEVMKKNPRHSVTRPDIFKFPWVVVKPESILVPGKVFFIVPNRTIYRLIKDYENRNQSSSEQTQPSRTHVHQQSHEQSSKHKSYAGFTPKHQNHRQGLKKQVQVSCWYRSIPREQDYDERVKSQSQVGSWPRVIGKNKNHRTTHLFPEENSSVDSSFEIRSSQATTSSKKCMPLAITRYGLESKPRKQVAELKSCVRKQDSARKLLPLRVSFVLPNKDEEQQEERVPDCQTEFPGFLICS